MLPSEDEERILAVGVSESTTESLSLLSGVFERVGIRFKVGEEASTAADLAAALLKRYSDPSRKFWS